MGVGQKLHVSEPINFSNTFICLQNVCKLPQRKKKKSDHSLFPGSEKLQEHQVTAKYTPVFQFVYLFNYLFIYLFIFFFFGRGGGGQVASLQ